jgi:hypothetical protein
MAPTLNALTALNAPTLNAPTLNAPTLNALNARPPDRAERATARTNDNLGSGHPSARATLPPSRQGPGRVATGWPRSERGMV